MAYLDDYPPRVAQSGPRTKAPTGLTVIHTAESVLDQIAPDTGAEAVAAFIAGRSDYGSYHDVADADSEVQLVRYELAAWQDGTGSNPYALSISFALRASDWPKLTPERRDAFLRNGAAAFAQQQAWLKARGYPTTPLRRITRSQSTAGVAGFISHAERDPARRTDPGPAFPWDRFLQLCAVAVAGTLPGTPGGFLMALNDEEQAELYNWMHAVQGVLGELNAYLRFGGDGDKVLRETYNAAAQARDLSAQTLTAVAHLPGADIDEAALAAHLAPLIEAQIEALSDVDLDRIAERVADVQAKRQVA